MKILRPKQNKHMCKHKRQSWFLIATTLTVFFVVFTLTLKLVDMQSDSSQFIGWASINIWWRDLIGVHFSWHIISHFIALISLLVLTGILIWQVITVFHRRKLSALTRNWWVFDITLLALGLSYLLFQIVAINYRPIQVDGAIEISYPSSHSLLITTTWLLIIFRLRREIQSQTWRRILIIVGWTLMLTGVIARLLCGYHWFTDIVGGVLLGTVFAAWYQAFVVE